MANEEQARRVGLNEALFREVNEEIQGINRTFRDVETMTILCECGVSGCTEQIAIGVTEYQQVRRDARAFIVVPGHDLPEFEDVVDRGEGYEVVRKHRGVPSEIAQETDPRS